MQVQQQKANQDTILTQAKQQQLTQYSGIDEKVARATSKEGVKSIRVKRISEAMNTDLFATLNQINNIEEKKGLEKGTGGMGMMFVNSVLQNLIRTRIVSLTSVFGGANDDQIESICEMIFDDFSFWTIADVKLCFTKGIKGEFGEVKRIDTSVIYSWCKKYDTKRTILVRKQLEEIEKSEKAALLNSPTLTFLPDSLSQLGFKLRANRDSNASQKGKLSRSLQQKLHVPIQIKSKILNL